MSQCSMHIICFDQNTACLKAGDNMNTLLNNMATQWLEKNETQHNLGLGVIDVKT